MVLPPALSAPPPLPTQATDTAAAKEGTKLEGMPDSINANKPPKNYKDAMSREDSREWQEAYFKEYKGMMDRGAVQAVKPPPGAKILGTTTRTEYKTSNDIFDKRKVRMCVRGDQQVELWKDKTSSSKICTHPPSRHKRHVLLQPFPRSMA